MKKEPITEKDRPKPTPKPRRSTYVSINGMHRKPRTPLPRPTKWHSNKRRPPACYCPVCGCELLIGQTSVCDNCLVDMEEGLYDHVEDFHRAKYEVDILVYPDKEDRK